MAGHQIMSTMVISESLNLNWKRQVTQQKLKIHSKELKITKSQHIC